MLLAFLHDHRVSVQVGRCLLQLGVLYQRVILERMRTADKTLIVLGCCSESYLELTIWFCPCAQKTTTLTYDRSFEFWIGLKDCLGFSPTCCYVRHQRRSMS
jgi:hypothetical protein